MAFDYPNVSSGMHNIPTYANSVTDGYLGTMLLLTVFMGIIVMYPRSGSLGSKLVVSCFLTSLAGILFFLMGIVGETQLMVCIVAAAVSMVVVGGE